MRNPIRVYRLLRAGKYAKIARMKSRQSAYELRKMVDGLSPRERQKYLRLAKLYRKIDDIAGPRKPVKGERQFDKIEREAEATRWAIVELRKLQFLGKFPWNRTSDLLHMAVSVDFGRAHRHRENYLHGVYGPEVIEAVVQIIALRSLSSGVEQDREFMSSWALDEKEKKKKKKKLKPA